MSDKTLNFQRNQLETPAQYVKGVGPKLAKILEKLGINTVRDLLFFFPRDYEDRRNPRKIASLRLGETVFIKGSISKIKLNRLRRMQLLKVKLKDSSGSINTVFFNQPYLVKTFKLGMEIFVFGRVENSYSGIGLEINVRRFEIVGPDNSLSIVPIYPLTEGLFSRKMRSIVKNAFKKFVLCLHDYLPDFMREKYGLFGLRQAMIGIHFPQDIQTQKNAHFRLAFDDFFVFQLGLLLRKSGFKAKGKGISFKVENELVKNFIACLPFSLTNAQKKVIEEIKDDMASELPMNRLIQGDVGCGKTIVALIASLIAIQNGYQVAIMAPTEILAKQHFEKIKNWLKDLNIKVELLISGIQNKDKQRIIKELKDSKINLLVGTHALIEEKVKFSKLGLAIVDEQHRFGVLQRSVLTQKGFNPDVLFLTATPIPRSLALILYGDLDRSVINELPPGRKAIKTFYVPENKRNDAYKFIREKVESGDQVFIVYPLVEESKELDLKAATEEAEFLQNEIFKEFKVGLVHGRLDTRSKDEIMSKFRKGEIQILVSTTVIEVGIDIPQATIMIIEHADRFGLLQLHQLRGRIGRGSKESFCFLMAEPKTNEARSRLSAFVNYSDGFEIAEADLKIRGPGDVYGVRQAGMPNFYIADLIKDVEILNMAREAAKWFLSLDPNLDMNPALKEHLFLRFGDFLKLRG